MKVLVVTISEEDDDYNTEDIKEKKLFVEYLHELTEEYTIDLIDNRKPISCCDGCQEKGYEG